MAAEASYRKLALRLPNKVNLGGLSNSISTAICWPTPDQPEKFESGKKEKRKREGKKEG